MEKLEDWVRNFDPYFTLAGLLFGFIGFFFAIYFYYKTKLVKNFSFSSRRVHVVNKSDKYKKLQFLYDGKPIENLIASVIVFWNSGNVTIDKSDNVPLSPVTISVPEDETIYDIEITSTTNVSNDFKLVQEDGRVFVLEFEYIDKNDGCVIRFLHSGKSIISGKIKGIKLFRFVPSINIRELTERRILGSNWVARNLGIIVLTILFVTFLTVGIIKASGSILATSLLLALFMLVDRLLKKTLPEKLHNSFLNS